MNRRDLLKTIILSTLSIPLMGFSKHFTPASYLSPAPLQLKFGEYDLYILSDGSNLIKEPYPLIAPNHTEEEFNLALNETFLDQQPISFSLNVLLIKYKQHYILFDTGNGLEKNENVGKLIQQLESTGISADEITDVIITHAHGDHIGGLIQPNGNLTFKNAKYFMSKTEFEYWLTSKNENTIAILNKIRPKTIFIKGKDIMFNNIKIEEVPGHTPGQLAFLISDKNNTIKIKHIADVVHSPIIVRYPEFGIKYDINFNEAVQTRLKILEEAYQKKQLIFATHLPWPGIGYIDKKDDRYLWTPFSFESNLKQIQL